MKRVLEVYADVLGGLLSVWLVFLPLLVAVEFRWTEWPARICLIVIFLVGLVRTVNCMGAK